MKFKIGVITHYKEMEANYSLLAKELRCDLKFGVGVMNYAIKMACDMEQNQGLNAIIASAATAKIIQEYVEIPVIPLHIRSENVYEAMYRAHQVGEKIAFADINKEVLYDIERVAMVLGYDIKCYPFTDLSQTQQVVSQTIADGRQVLVTPASCMYRCAEKNKLAAELILLTSQDVRDAIEHAKYILKIKEQQSEQNKWMAAVVNNATEGVITFDKNNKITLANQMAAKMLQLTPANLIGKKGKELRNKGDLINKIVDSIDEFQVVQEKGKQYVINRQNVDSSFENLGSVVRVNEFENIASTEMRARKCVSATGFVAEFSFEDIKGVSVKTLETKQKAMRYAQTDASILILGESGSGKEIYAQSIHNASRCSAGPFVAVNCTTLPENLLDSELFGYEDGAFTGAKKGGKAGLFEMAHGGTLFMDEIGDMPLHLQVKLLRVLQEKVVRRIGGSRNIPINVRLIFATNKDLYKDVLDKNFREDLYYRINVLELKLSSLRERKEDIAILAHHFISQKGNDSAQIPAITPEQEQRLQAYPWPGNTRELSNFVDRLVALSSQGFYNENPIDSMLEEFRFSKREEVTLTAAPNKHLLVPLGTLREIEDSVLTQVLERCGGRKKEMEQILGISTTTLWRRLKEIS